MSKCPWCHAPGRHIGLFVPREPAMPVEVLHECTDAGCKVKRWSEPATHPLASILAGWGRDLTEQSKLDAKARGWWGR